MTRTLILLAYSYLHSIIIHLLHTSLYFIAIPFNYACLYVLDFVVLTIKTPLKRIRNNYFVSVLAINLQMYIHM